MHLAAVKLVDSFQGSMNAAILKQFKNYRKHSALHNIVQGTCPSNNICCVRRHRLGGGKKDGQSYWQFYKEYSEVRLSHIRCGNR